MIRRNDESGRASRKRPKRPASERARPRSEIKKALEASFRRRFPQDTVDVSDGYKDNLHVLVVSRQFDNMTEQNKQDLLWGIIDATDLTEKEKSLISRSCL
jgi:hypothetical protein